MSNSKKAVNVISTHKSRRLWSRQSMLVWINQCLKSNLSKIDHLGTGAAYCSLMDILFPDSVNMRRVKFASLLENDFKNNFALLQQAFKKHGVEKIIPVNELVKGKFQDNYDFVIWFRLFYNANFKKVAEGYDVEKRRCGQSFIVGAVPKWYHRSHTTLTLINEDSKPKGAGDFVSPRQLVRNACNRGVTSQE
ncbi:microtubule-associated protein RP/EB family member 1-like [Drosophila sulfurigaster albostrigata]|uniref:microtubule-associated protein RP/EB family member 1-like n=1 Tax=Drosophila sulfurigaster albostrigata TaxID=89887 RepID=UPI002D21A363|nr:microtubule-associated protein RP/EB family member 1-like [Drosophila sulfurigaster albostrigata]